MHDALFVRGVERIDDCSATAIASSTAVSRSPALSSLTRLEPRRAQVIELRFVGGLNVAETPSRGPWHLAANNDAQRAPPRRPVFSMSVHKCAQSS